MSTERGPLSVTARPLHEDELGAADDLFHVAFGTFVGLPEPRAFAAGHDFITNRWHDLPESVIGAFAGGELVGISAALDWGSTAIIGPVAVHPDHWGRGVAQRLFEPTMELVRGWGATFAGLFTFPHSTMHVHLYQKFGFWPRFLTAIMTSPVSPRQRVPATDRYSALSRDQQAACLAASLVLTDGLYPGLDLRREIQAVEAQALGETVLLSDHSGLAGFALCHCGQGTEAGPDTVYVKFGAVRSGAGAEQRLGALLDACEALAVERGLSRLLAGVNTAREEAYRALLARGMRTAFQGVAMHRPNEPAFCRPGAWVLDDWR